MEGKLVYDVQVMSYYRDPNSILGGGDTDWISMATAIMSISGYKKMQ